MVPDLVLLVLIAVYTGDQRYKLIMYICCTYVVHIVVLMHIFQPGTTTGLVIFDTVSFWSIERKSRTAIAQAEAVDSEAPGPGGDISRGQQSASLSAHPAAGPSTNAAARSMSTQGYRSSTSLLMVVYELCLCGVMLGAVATWYFYATALVRDDAFKTQCVAAARMDGCVDLGPGSMRDCET